MNMHKTAVMFLLISLATANAAYAESDMIAIGEDKFTIAAGRFLPAFNTKVRVAGEGLGPGDNVDVEDDLGIKRNDSSAYFSASWRFSPKHRIFANFFQSSRQSEVVAEKEIQIGDEVYPAGATLNTKLSFNFVPVTYAYTMTKSERSELAITGGLHWNSIKLKVQGSASTGGQDLDAEVVSKVDAPMPLVGLDYAYGFTPQWTGNVRAEVFWFDFSGSIDVGGTIVNLRLGTDYWFTRNFGLGAAVNYFEFDVDVDSGTWDGTLNYGYFGPQVYAQARW